MKIYPKASIFFTVTLGRIVSAEDAEALRELAKEHDGHFTPGQGIIAPRYSFRNQTDAGTFLAAIQVAQDEELIETTDPDAVRKECLRIMAEENFVNAVAYLRGKSNCGLKEAVNGCRAMQEGAGPNTIDHKLDRLRALGATVEVNPRNIHFAMINGERVNYGDLMEEIEKLEKDQPIHPSDCDDRE